MSADRPNDEKIENAMRMANRLVSEMGKASDAAFLASMKAFVGHLQADPFLKIVSADLAANRRVNFAAWHAKAVADHKYEPPALRPDEAAILFTLFQKIDRREISVTDFMMEIDGLLRMDRCYSEFTAKYVQRFIGYLEWVIAEKQVRSSQIAAAAEGASPRGPDLFAIDLQKATFERFIGSLRAAVETGLSAEEVPAALEELARLSRGFTGEATPTEESAAVERLSKAYDYFRTRLEDFCSGAELLHLPEDLPPFVKALRSGLGQA
ncbi:MAG: hypothetical protein ACREJ2_13465 [Planctomycetota bacterium]